MAAILGQEYLQDMQPTNPDVAMEEFQQKMNAMQADFKIPNVILTGLNLIVGGLLFIGGIGVQTKKSWGGNLLSTAVLIAAFYCFIRMAFGVYMQVGMMGPMGEAAKTLSKENPEAGQMMETIMTASLYGGIIMGIVMALGLIGFYLWSWMYLKKDHVVSYLATFK